MRLFFRLTLISSLLFAAFLLTVYLINRYIHGVTDQLVKNSITAIPIEEPRRIAIVFGAKVYENGEPSNALEDRVITAVELYRAGRVSKLLMSGDNPSADYDEPTAMKKAAMNLGVPEENIVLDFAGRRTYDTCFRAKEIFEVKKAVLVTQEFHQARALYLCNQMGVESIGITANRRKYIGENYWNFREFFSLGSAWFEMNFIPFAPITGKKEPIPPED